MRVVVVIMAGGMGERFWPVSRRKRPKQLLALFGKQSMIEVTVDRIKKTLGNVEIYIITNRIQVPSIRKLFKKNRNIKIISEPGSRNTAPCISVAAVDIVNKKDGVMVVLPADHIIKGLKYFQRNLKKAIKFAEEGYLVTVGIKPSFPHTGYGYIERGKEIVKGCFKVKRFTEKPDYNTASKYISTGRYYWNSGMFVWKSSVILSEMQKFLPEVYKMSLWYGKKSLATIYKRMPSVSIDYGVMEKTNRAVVVEAGFDWNDVGDWNSLSKHLPLDKDGNVCLGKVLNIETSHCIVYSDEPLVATVGLKNLIIVVTKDAILVCNREESQKVKEVVGVLKKQGLNKYL